MQDGSRSEVNGEQIPMDRAMDARGGARTFAVLRQVGRPEQAHCGPRVLSASHPYELITHKTVTRPVPHCTGGGVK